MFYDMPRVVLQCPTLKRGVITLSPLKASVVVGLFR